MNTKKYVYWQDGQMWIGHFEEYPEGAFQKNRSLKARTSGQTP
jgi:hypothetical protein